MIIADRNNKLKYFIACLKCEVSGKSCDVNCATQYDAGTMGEIIENLEAISKALEQEACEDCISRQAVKEILHKRGQKAVITFEHFEELVNKLPPVRPQQKMGHWVFTKTIFNKYGCTAECSDCRKKWKTYDTIRFEKEHDYCPNCGAKMEGVE